MKYGNAMSRPPETADSRVSIARPSLRRPARSSGASKPSSTSTNRDMCVPLTSCGRPTDIANSATVCCTPPEAVESAIG